jgi:hypothetical protein
MKPPGLIRCRVETQQVSDMIDFDGLDQTQVYPRGEKHTLINFVAVGGDSDLTMMRIMTMTIQHFQHARQIRSNKKKHSRHLFKNTMLECTRQ